MKPTIFLGSSANHLDVLKQVSAFIGDTGDCVLWPKAFVQNKSNLDSLIRQTKLADFSVLLAMKDDLLWKKNEVHEVARDNVIFEFGLFLGSSGVYKSFLLVEDGINLPSDLDGIALGRFTLETGKYNSLDKVCEEIKAGINAASRVSDLGFLPSTALALGYYYNFIRKVCEELHNTSKIVTAGNKEISLKDFILKIIVPENLDDNGVDAFRSMYNKKNDLRTATTGSIANKRGFPFVFRIEPPDQDENENIAIELSDVPTTLNTILESIKLFMPKEQVGHFEELEYLEKRELANFCKVLRYLISKNTATKNHVIVEEDITI
jgi:hypothetical protein